MAQAKATSTGKADETGDGGSNDNVTTTSKLESNNQENSKDSNNNSNDPNTKNESPFVKLLRGVKIAGLEKEIKEDGEMTSILGKFKDIEGDLIDMTQDDSKKQDIVTTVVDCTGISRGKANVFVTRLLKAYPKQSQSNGM